VGKQSLQGLKFNPVKGVKARLKGFTISRLIPNFVTLAALCAGVSSIRFALEGRYESAILFLVLAMLLDGVDGRLARLLGGETRFGAELDSLADLVNFGLSPALILYLYTLKSLNSLGWSAGLIFVVCGALRLARFNVISIEEEQTGDCNTVPKGFFMGVPITIAAFLVLAPMFLGVNTSFKINVPPIITLLWTFFISFLMISKLFIFSFKKMHIPKKSILPLCLSVAILIVLLIEATWLTFFGVGIVYVCFIPFSHKQAKKTCKSYEIHT
jgi:CDP-diacylglycerol--serine O-phosphatidyltransferase